jgi:signal transduction histidine kinase
LSQRGFLLQGRSHRLYLIKRMTRELSRQEVSTWKKLIRVLSHELNNSLAPIASLAHSGAEVTRRGDTANLADVFATIGERAQHLHQFIAGYASFAKLPAPRIEPADWQALTEELQHEQPFRLLAPLPSSPGWFDRAQLAQALINLLKNAHEAAGDGGEVELLVLQDDARQHIEVRDRGPGMSEVVMSQALLPFYSTKRSGTGLGLALAREIAEAHGGHIKLENREGGGLSVTLSLPLPTHRS